MLDHIYMQRALELASYAAQRDEVPVGAVMVCNQTIVGQGFNRREEEHDPLAHAEIEAIHMSAQRLGRWRLNDCTLYVTLEPCAMCAGALVNARVGRLVFGAKDPKAGAVVSLMQVCTDSRLNHRLEVTGGVMEEECGVMLKAFFAKLRK